MNKAKPADEHYSELLNSLLQEITPEEQERTDNKMLLAAKIDEAREKKGWTKKQFAKAMGQKPSVVSKWLSGTHNFTSDTLWDIETKLGIELIALKERELKVVRVIRYQVFVDGPPIEPSPFKSPYLINQRRKGTGTHLSSVEKFYA